MFIDVVFTHAEVAHIDLRRFGYIGVIDVLRATTTSVTALENGAQGVVPVATPEDARELAAKLVAASNDVLLAGERGARMIPGFDLGNSPLDCTPEAVAGKLIVQTTTNGTQAFQSVQAGTVASDIAPRVGAQIGTRAGAGAQVEARADGPIIVAACLRNAAAVAREFASGVGMDRKPPGIGDSEDSDGNSAALLVCAGTDGRFSWDDAYCAAVIVTELASLISPISPQYGDGARAAMRMLYGSVQTEREGASGSGVGDRPSTGNADPPSARVGDRPSARVGDRPSAGVGDRPSARIGDSPVGASGGESGETVSRRAVSGETAFAELSASEHGRRLLAMGLDADVKFCAEMSVSDVVPRLIMGMLVSEGTGQDDGEYVAWNPLQPSKHTCAMNGNGPEHSQGVSEAADDT